MMKIHYDDPNARRIQNILEGAHFPCRKSDVVGLARTREADKNVVSLLEALPEREFSSLREVIEIAVHTSV